MNFPQPGKYWRRCPPISKTSSWARRDEPPFDRDVVPLLERVKSLTPEQLATPVNFMNFANLPAVIYIGWWANHMIHHRGQLSTYLRAMNAHVPSIYGGSADEPYGMAATA